MVDDRTARPVLSASTGAIGLGPYGDEAEHVGPPQIIVVPDIHRPFFATDARSVMITLLPQHYNFIPNPAFRVNTTGWESKGIEPVSTAFSWRVANTNTKASLDAIIAKTSTTSVDPNPSTAPVYVNGQLVKVVDSLAADKTVAWLVIDNAATLTVAQAAAVGITISGNVSKYRVWDPLTDPAGLSTDSWVGRSVVCNGTGYLRYREGSNKFVYVGPQVGVDVSQRDERRGGPEYTVSVYAKGSGEVRLKMDAYYPADRATPETGPEFQNLLSVASPSTYAAGQAAIVETSTGHVWTAISPTPAAAPFYESTGRPPAFATMPGEWTGVDDDGEWHRVVLTTRARVPENEGQVSFMGCAWIDTLVEVRNANNLKISAVMLDAGEYPRCAYFDGDMTEDFTLDDFLWEDTANNSVSLYYFDRVVRTKWLYDRLGYVVPAGRPYQIFFGSYWRPYVGATGETIIMPVP